MPVDCSICPETDRFGEKNGRIRKWTNAAEYGTLKYISGIIYKLFVPLYIGNRIGMTKKLRLRNTGAEKVGVIFIFLIG